MKNCIIYKTDNAYKVITESTTVDWLGIATEPIFLLPLTCNLNDLQKAVFDCLDNSEINIQSPKRDEWPNRQAYLLSKLQEKSFSALNKRSKSCHIQLENNILKVIPYQLDKVNKPSGGLVFDNDKEVEFRYNESDDEKNEMTKIIIDLLR